MLRQKNQQFKKIEYKKIDMSWYGTYNDGIKQLENLIDRRPALWELFQNSDFLQQLKAFHPKLLDYLSNSKQIPNQMISYLTIAPTDTDSFDRKHKYPLFTIQMIETETTCIVNSFFRETQIKGVNYLVQAFSLLKKETVLPLLSGYFLRMHETLLRVKYREAVETVYRSPECFDHFLRHCAHHSIAVCLQLYLNLDINKQQYPSPQKLTIKIDVIRKILELLSNEEKKAGEDSGVIAENLILILNEIVDKYYLIADGKAMMDQLLNEKSISMLMGMVSRQSEFSLNAMQLCLCLMKYYSFSSFNSEDGSEELRRKNMERLEAQPLIQYLITNFASLLSVITNAPRMTLYHYKLLEVLCHCITLSSHKIFITIKQTFFYSILLDLLFKHEKCSILHRLIEKAFLHLFSNQKRIYDTYKQYLFCQLKIIEKTAGRLVEGVAGQSLQIARKKGYFGTLIKIIKLYSGIQTSDINIKQAVLACNALWNKFVHNFIKAYDSLCTQQLGTYTNNKDPAPLEFSMKKNLEVLPSMVNNTQVIEQINREQTATNLKTLQAESKKQETNHLQAPKLEEDTFFHVPISETLERKHSEEVTAQKKDSSEKQKQIDHPLKQLRKIQQPQKKSDSELEKKQNSSFSEFLVKEKKKAGEEIKAQRSISTEKKLSANRRARIASPSPNRKKNSWQEDDQKVQEKPKPRIQFTKDLPKVPTGHQKLTQSTVTTVQKKESDKEVINQRFVKSMTNFDELKKIMIVKVDGAKQKKFRKVAQKDKILLDYLGINI